MQLGPGCARVTWHPELALEAREGTDGVGAFGLPSGRWTPDAAWKPPTLNRTCSRRFPGPLAAGLTLQGSYGDSHGLGCWHHRVSRSCLLGASCLNLGGQSP